ncbi:MAG: AAA family ATPase [Caldilineaceae bacterium]|nr:AAA family ATPase [Caldilineaceae bacterium]
MRLQEVRISGFQSIPFCADYAVESGARRGRLATARIAWQPDAYHFSLPVTAASGSPMLSALIGPNSAGKSTVLMALAYAFGTAVRLDESLYHGKDTSQPIIVELTLSGPLATPNQWQREHCYDDGDRGSLTVAHVWNAEGRVRYIRRPDGRWIRLNQEGRRQVDRLMPAFRLIASDSRLSDEADMEKRTLLSALIDAMLARSQPTQSVVRHLSRLMDELNRLTDRSRANGEVSWQVIEELETRLSRGMAAAVPDMQRVRLQLNRQIRTVRSVFATGSVQVDDGVELDFERHGLGLQRSFVVSALDAWCDYVRDTTKNYLFAIEEPEIYLHPHATRQMLATLERLAGKDQVLFTTHSSEFVNRTPLHNVLSVRRSVQNGLPASHIVKPDLSALPMDTVTKVQRYLCEDRSDMLFARAVLLVEGQAELFALPAFARTLGLDFDGAGVSVVFVNGYGNFPTYHHILHSMGIPHVILMDGDGHRAERQRQFAPYADVVLVLEQDFEAQVVAALTPARLGAVVDICLERKGRQPRQKAARLNNKELASYGKPLVGRVLGEELTADEIRNMPVLVEGLSTALTLARHGSTAARAEDREGIKGAALNGSR